MRKNFYLAGKLLSLLLLTLPLPSLYAQNLRLPIKNYSNKEYGRIYEATNNCILSDQRNLVYSGNANGILEYDGSSWRYITVRRGAHVVSMDISPSGTIYVGSQQEFGYLAPDDRGAMLYHSLSDRLPEEDRFFTTIWKTWSTAAMTVFQSEECLFILRNDSLQAIYPDTEFHTSFLLGDRLYARERGSGLKIFLNGQFREVQGGRVFANLGIFGMFPSGENGSVLIVTNERGFYVLDPETGIERLPTPNDPFLIRAGILGGIETRDGNIALNTTHEGVLICDPNGRLLAAVNKQTGLADNDVKGLWQDAHQNIWCALGKGIARIDYSSPVSYYDENAGLDGSVYAILEHQGKIWAGTTAGLFVETERSSLNASLDFKPIPDIRDQVFSLAEVNDQLVVGTTNGVFVIHNGRVRLVSQLHCLVLLYLVEENILLVGGRDGLSALSPRQNWRMTNAFSDINVIVNSIAVNRSTTYDAREIWLGTQFQGTVKLLLQPDLAYDFTQYYGMGDGLPEEWINPFAQGDSIIFGTGGGVFRVTDEEVLRAALPDSLKNRPEFYRAYFEPADRFGEKRLFPLSQYAETSTRQWAILNNRIFMLEDSETEQLIEKPFLGMDLGELHTIYSQDDNTVWFGADDGLARFDLQNLYKTKTQPTVLIRAVIATADSLIFYGTDPAVYGALDFSLNDLTFYFTSPYFDNEAANEFSWSLGKDTEEWTEWSGRRIVSYTNLREGRYEFRLRARNIYGDVSETASWQFSIRPPWTRTFPAYLLYLVLLLSLGYLAVKTGQIQLRRKNERLEAIVAERTEEIRQQNRELALQKKEITDSIYYAERIQRAILPKTTNIGHRISEHFILFRPKDIVSGDFYWLAESKDRIIVTAADCTGHGVPGAFMSMLGVSFLNKIILENRITDADAILNALRENVISSLKQTGQEGEARDGMDMALVVIDLRNMSLEFAGANNPLYLIRQDELNETKADRMPIAFQRDASDFSRHKIKLTKGDSLYIFSDGYADQFGGPRGKKFMYKPFKRLLVGNQKKSMSEIQELLEKNLDDWMAPEGEQGTRYEQVDDILVIGLRI